MITIIPLVNNNGNPNIEAIMNGWKYYSKGMTKVIIHSKEDLTIDLALNQILSGFVILNLILEDDIYKGFFTSRIDIIGGKRCFAINQMFLDSRGDNEFLFKMDTEIMEITKRFDCSHIYFWTTREKGFKEKLESIGYKPTYTEFVKEVNYGR